MPHGSIDVITQRHPTHNKQQTSQANARVLARSYCPVLKPPTPTPPTYLAALSNSNNTPPPRQLQAHVYVRFRVSVVWVTAGCRAP
jgi:hypothetical protein